MPYSQCPNCGYTVHHNVPDLDSWIARIKSQYPDWDGKDMAPIECLDCYKKEHKDEPKEENCEGNVSGSSL